jgi:hypothetical protein
LSTFGVPEATNIAPPFGWTMASAASVVVVGIPAAPPDPINASRKYSINGIPLSPFWLAFAHPLLIS